MLPGLVWSEPDRPGRLRCLWGCMVGGMHGAAVVTNDEDETQRWTVHVEGQTPITPTSTAPNSPGTLVGRCQSVLFAFMPARELRVTEPSLHPHDIFCKNSWHQQGQAAPELRLYSGIRTCVAWILHAPLCPRAGRGSMCRCGVVALRLRQVAVSRLPTNRAQDGEASGGHEGV